MVWYGKLQQVLMPLSHCTNPKRVRGENQGRNCTYRNGSPDEQTPRSSKMFYVPVSVILAPPRVVHVNTAAENSVSHKWPATGDNQIKVSFVALGRLSFTLSLLITPIKFTNFLDAENKRGPPFMAPISFRCEPRNGSMGWPLGYPAFWFRIRRQVFFIFS